MRDAPSPNTWRSDWRASRHAESCRAQRFLDDPAFGRVILTLATLMGRAWGSLFPYRLRGPVRFYLAPVLGLATLTIIASLLGRILPLGNSVVVPVLVVSLTVWALVRESNITQAFRHSMWVSVFSLACGASVLGPLFAFGGFNAHNDGFTYLAHSNWLQGHAFGDAISAEQVTPLTTQVLLYQREGFRMGGILPARPCAIAAQSAMVLRGLSRRRHLGHCGLLSCHRFPLGAVIAPRSPPHSPCTTCLPAFTLGGLVFGANLGFLPQTLGSVHRGGAVVCGRPVASMGLDRRLVAPGNRQGGTSCRSAFLSRRLRLFRTGPLPRGGCLGKRFRSRSSFSRWGRVLEYTGVLLGLAASCSIPN